MIIGGLPQKLPKDESIALIKIKCAYKAYKDYPTIAQFYHGINDDGSIYAIIGEISGYINLWWDKSNAEELKSFLAFTPFKGVFTDMDSAKLLELNINEKCLVFKSVPPFNSLPPQENHTPRELMEALKEGLNINNEDDFIADVTFRAMHNCADFVVMQGGGALVYYCESEALLNGIAVNSLGRGKGTGTFLLNIIKSKIENRNLYACCIEKNKEFYIKNGFSHIGYAAYCEEK